MTREMVQAGTSRSSTNVRAAVRSKPETDVSARRRSVAAATSVGRSTLTRSILRKECLKSARHRPAVPPKPEAKAREAALAGGELTRAGMLKHHHPRVATKPPRSFLGE